MPAIVLENPTVDLSPVPVRRLIDLYEKNFNTLYPVISPDRLHIFASDAHIASTVSKPSAEHKLFLLILALGSIYDNSASHYENFSHKSLYEGYIPGLDYFNVADGIRGETYSLFYAQAEILASLYYKQLDQLEKSLTAINRAAKVLHDILRR